MEPITYLAHRIQQPIPKVQIKKFFQLKNNKLLKGVKKQ